jgi:hypothetical protein
MLFRCRVTKALRLPGSVTCASSQPQSASHALGILEARNIGQRAAFP